MIREFVNQVFIGDYSYREYFGLSGDTKPTTAKIITGSKFTEVDTGDVYLFDEVGKEWHKVQAGWTDPEENAGGGE